MPDDLDNQIRSAMKVLDEQTPSGYFDAVPNQILARLEDGSMQHGSGTTDIRDKRDALMGPPVVADTDDTNKTPKAAAADREEDSGLHDIRNLAQSTKQRLSNRRITQNPPVDTDVLASSSGSFANIALPQPAKMVALPELEDLPSKQEILAAQKVAEKARKARAGKAETVNPPVRASESILAPNATANAALASLTAAPVAVDAAPAASASFRQPFTLPSMERKKSKGPLIAVLGMGVAAAAGGLLFMNMNKDEKASSASMAPAAQDTAVKAAEPTPAPAPVVAAPVEPAPPPAPPVEEEAKAADTGAAAGAPADDDAKPRTKRAAKGGKKTDVEVEKKKDEPKVETKVEPKVEPKLPEGMKKAGGGEGEPSFDALLKEAGVDEKKEVKPKLDKKSLSGDDFKKGMSSVQTKAQGCYKGTQGTASVKLTVGPTGQVTKATVAGQFAGTPEGKCIEGAVKGATFPAWDGGPQSFNYSYMLAD